jgi:hypothetical protein
VNLAGHGEGLEFVGGCRSMSPLGEILYEAPSDREEVAVAPVAERDERADYVTLLRKVPTVSDKSASSSPALRRSLHDGNGEMAVEER